MVTADLIVRGRAAYDRRAWGEARDLLAAADDAAGQTGGLGGDELECYATAAYLTGDLDTAASVGARAYHVVLDRGDVERAARRAFWLGLGLILGGEPAQGGGWVARAARLLEDEPRDCAERGYVQIPGALQALEAGDADTAHQTFVEVTRIADRFADADLQALGRLGCGQALVAAGDVERGVGMLDEAMIAVTGDELSPIVTGIIYCAVIIACRDIMDVRRAQEWTAALSRWCATQPDLHPYRGQCLVHRSEIMQLRGEWADALAEVRRACEHLSAPAGDPVLGMALYQQAELLRLKGEFAAAEQSYRSASAWGHTVQPGLALLRLAQGRPAHAAAAIRPVAADPGPPGDRCRALAALVEIALAAGDVAQARAGADELTATAAALDVVYLNALAGVARGAVLLAEGAHEAALGELRRAWTAWQQLDVPYEAARVRVLIARVCHDLGDDDTAEMELDAACLVLEHLGAAPELARAQELARSAGRRTEHGPAHAASGLTRRELEVLRFVATGATNREIADALVISDKTVARHLSNMFTKLDVSSRAAATAYAYEHHLV